MAKKRKHPSCEDDLTLQLRVLKGCAGFGEAITELDRRGKPHNPPDLRQKVIEAPYVDEPDKWLTELQAKDNATRVDFENYSGSSSDSPTSIKGEATEDLNNLSDSLRSLSDHDGLISIKNTAGKIADSVDWLWDFIGNKCGDIPDSKQKKVIQVRIGKIENNVRTLSGVITSLGYRGATSENYLVFLRPVQKYLDQKEPELPSPLKSLIGKLEKGKEDRIILEKPKPLALADLAALECVLEKMLENEELSKRKVLISNMKKLKTATKRLGDYICDKCKETPTMSQKTNIWGRLGKIEDVMVHIETSIGATQEVSYDRLTEYFKTTREFSGQVIIRTSREEVIHG